MTETAWAAGLFEGEGTVRSEPRHAYPVLSMGSSDRDVLERFAAAVGAGRVKGPYEGQGRKTPAHYKPMYQWQLVGARAVQRVLREFWPYLGERRRAKAANVIADYCLADVKRVPARRNTRAYSG